MIQEEMYEKINEENERIIELVGMEMYLIFLKEFGGHTVYFPKTDTFEKQQRNRKMWADFNGANYKELATKYKLSESHTRLILNSFFGRSGRLAENQTDIFEFLED